MISDGSELLLLIPSWRGLVGSIVLPILGAVPDGAIVLFSGLGADAKSQVAVGVGALAGSTIMLLTVPWFLSILAGRVDMARNNATGKTEPNYSKRSGGASKLTANLSFSENLFNTGVSLTSASQFGGKIMVASSLLYLVIQGPAINQLMNDDNNDDIAANVRANSEHGSAIAGLVLCVCGFIAYILYQVKSANFDEKAEHVAEKAISNASMSISGLFHAEFNDALLCNSLGDEAHLLPSETRKFTNFLQKKFKHYDVNGDNQIDSLELRSLFNDLNEKMSDAEFKAALRNMDKDGNGHIDFDEFQSAMISHVSHKHEAGGQKLDYSTNKEVLGINGVDMKPTGNDEDGEEEDDEEEEEIPEDISSLPPAEQQKRIRLRAMWMMALGTAIVLLFSDPMVDVLDSIGSRTGVPAFYIAFILAPLASNASELIAAYNYAQKKTKKTVNISFATLEGAAVMNNTFCLSIFLFIVVYQDIDWIFSAETISIMLIQFLVAIYAQKKTHTMFDGYCIIMFYPLALFIVYLLENFTSLK